MKMKDTQTLVNVANILIDLAEKHEHTTYGKLAKDIGIPRGERVMRIPLDILSNKCGELDLPYISALVFLSDKKIPSSGFFEVILQEYDKTKWKELHKEELEKVYNCKNYYKLTDSVKNMNKDN